MTKTVVINEKVKEMLDNCKIIPDESYNNEIKRLCEFYQKYHSEQKIEPIVINPNSEIRDPISDVEPSEEKNSANFSDEPKEPEHNLLYDKDIDPNAV